MALTATATKETRVKVMKVLGMAPSTCTVFNTSPEKANIYLNVKEKMPIQDFVQRVSKSIVRDEILSKKLLIFCRTYDDYYRFYRGFRSTLGHKFTIPMNAPNLPRFRVVDMYTRCTQNAVKEHIVTEFSKPEGKLRVVIATIAFGMGVNCPNISYVVHWGPSETSEDYVQEIGRAGRDGKPACAILFYTPRDKLHVEGKMVQYSTKHDRCKRLELFHPFDSFISDNRSVFGCKCCFICASSCQCGDCDSYLASFSYDL